MTYRTFYHRAATDDTVESDDAQFMDRDTVIATAMQILRDPKDFFGVIDESGTTLQFLVEDDGSVWVEVPRPSERGSYGKRIPVEDVEPLLLAFGDAIHNDSVTGFVFRHW